MIIKERKPVALAEVKGYVKDLDEKKELKDYLKKYSKLKKEKSKAIAEEIRALDNPKIKEEDIVKISDFLPQDTEDLNKIFTEVSLNDEEAKAILDIVKKHEK
jgi:DNA-directed RNA polymerase subunit F